MVVILVFKEKNVPWVIFVWFYQKMQQKNSDNCIIIQALHYECHHVTGFCTNEYKSVWQISDCFDGIVSFIRMMVY